MDQDLRQEARAAVEGAAERLGVDPYRLARYLSNGRLADILGRLRESVEASGGTLSLTESYLDFLEQEIELRHGSGPATETDAAR